jgi:tripartite-type tricarboxylate transporter receptor subunit TctC
MKPKLAALAICLVGFANSASAQDYPAKAIHIVIPFGAGGGTDVLARFLVQPLAQKFGQPIIPENRTGGGGAIGATYVAKAPPDGYTILFGNDSLVSSKFLHRDLPFDPEKDLLPVALVAKTSYALLSSPQFPAKTLSEAIAVLRANPGKYSYASPGIGSGPHVAFEMIKAAGNLDVVHAAFQSGADALAAVIRGETQFTLHGLTIAAENPGKIIGLGITGDQRSPFMPDAPTLKEVGVDVSASTWFGVFAPAKTPPEVIAKLHGAINEALTDTSVKAGYEKIGYDVRPITQEQFASLYGADFPPIGKASPRLAFRRSNTIIARAAP